MTRRRRNRRCIADSIPRHDHQGAPGSVVVARASATSSPRRPRSKGAVAHRELPGPRSGGRPNGAGRPNRDGTCWAHRYEDDHPRRRRGGMDETRYPSRRPGGAGPRRPARAPKDLLTQANPRLRTPLSTDVDSRAERCHRMFLIGAERHEEPTHPQAIRMRHRNTRQNAVARVLAKLTCPEPVPTLRRLYDSEGELPT